VQWLLAMGELQIWHVIVLLISFAIVALLVWAVVSLTRRR